MPFRDILSMSPSLLSHAVAATVAATGVTMIAAPVVIGTTALGVIGFGAAGPIAGKHSSDQLQQTQE
jgi:putative Mn2+ efflux pump MntP